MKQLDTQKQTIFAQNSYEKKAKKIDYEIETNIKYFNPSFYKQFVEHMKLLKKLKANELKLAKQREQQEEKERQLKLNAKQKRK